MTQQTFANFIGIAPGSLSSIFNERTRPTLNVVENIKTRIPAINLNWLMFGTGSMYEDSKPADGSSNDIKQTTANVHTETMLDFSDTTSALSSVPGGRNIQGVNVTPNNSLKNDVKYFDKPQRHITEIRVYYDDQTWESFTPKK